MVSGQWAAGLVLSCVALTPALAQSAQPGCDIATSSYVVIAPPTRKPPSPVITAMPQTPCATIPNGYEGMLGQMSIDINGNENFGNEDDAGEGAEGGGSGPSQPPRWPPRRRPLPMPHR